MKPRTHLDRRIITERRRNSGTTSSRAQRTNQADVILLEIVPPEDRAAQVERIYDRVPYAKRQCMGLTYEHVRAVLDALRSN